MKDKFDQLTDLEKEITKLVELCNADMDEPVTMEVRGKSQDIFTRLNRILDQIMFYYFEKSVAPKLSNELCEKYKNKVYFPRQGDPKDLQGALGKFGASDLETSDPVAYAIIEKNQPYNGGNEWLHYLKKYSNLGHQKLISHMKKKETNLLIPGFGRINSEHNVKISNVSIDDLMIETITAGNGEIKGKMDARLNPQIETIIYYTVENDDINLIWLCQESLMRIKDIAAEFAELLK